MNAFGYVIRDIELLVLQWGQGGLVLLIDRRVQ